MIHFYFSLVDIIKKFNNIMLVLQLLIICCKSSSSTIRSIKSIKIYCKFSLIKLNQINNKININLNKKQQHKVFVQIQKFSCDLKACTFLCT